MQSVHSSRMKDSSCFFKVRREAGPAEEDEKDIIPIKIANVIWGHDPGLYRVSSRLLLLW